MASNPTFEGENSYEAIRDGNDKDKSHEYAELPARGRSAGHTAYSKSFIICLLLINLVVLAIGFGIGFGVAYGLFKPKADQDQGVGECATNPCQNGARCSTGVNGYKCICAAGYTGKFCDTDVDECASSPCQNGATCSDGVDGYQCICVAGYTGMTCNLEPRDCSDVKRAERGSVSGLYTINPNGTLSVRVYCDMDTDMGGWTVFQRRQNGRVDLYRTWEEYADGFGDSDGEVWLGNRLLHALTRRRNYSLRVDLGDWENNTFLAEYDLFVVSSEEDKFRLTLGNYSGTRVSGDSLRYNSGGQFSTRDQDNDVYGGHCAQVFRGAWWHRACSHCNLNGRYYPTGPYTAAQSQTGNWDGVRWYHWKGDWYSLKTTRMMIRPAS